jgi:uncharacterized protein (TIGR03435 family)
MRSIFRLSLPAALAALFSHLAFAQAPATPLSFEVASVKPASAPIATKDVYTEGYNAGMRAALASQGMRVVGQRVMVTDNTLKELIRIAYGVKEYQITAPAWMANEKYEVNAVMPAGATRGQAPEMLRALLEQRFHLALHRETKQMTVYALIAAKGGPKLTEAPAGGRGAWAGNVSGRVMARSASVAVFAESLSKATDHPVVDATGLKGLYNFELTFMPDAGAGEADTRPTLATALQEQLGLKLEKREMPMEILVIDRADKVPVEN